MKQKLTATYSSNIFEAPPPYTKQCSRCEGQIRERRPEIYLHDQAFWRGDHNKLWMEQRSAQCFRENPVSQEQTDKDPEGHRGCGCVAHFRWCHTRQPSHEPGGAGVAVWLCGGRLLRTGNGQHQGPETEFL